MLSSCPVNSTKPFFQRLALPPQSGLLKPKPHKSHHVPAIILVEFSHSAGNGEVAAELQRPVQLIAGVPAALTYRNRKYSSCCPPLWRGRVGLCSHPGAAQLHSTGGRRSPSPHHVVSEGRWCCGIAVPCKDGAVSSAPDGWVPGAERTPGKDVAVCCDLNVPC